MALQTAFSSEANAIYDKFLKLYTHIIQHLGKWVVSSNKGKSDTPTEEDISRYLDEDESDVVSGESDEFSFDTGEEAVPYFEVLSRTRKFQKLKNHKS